MVGVDRYLGGVVKRDVPVGAVRVGDVDGDWVPMVAVGDPELELAEVVVALFLDPQGRRG